MSCDIYFVRLNRKAIEVLRATSVSIFAVR